MVPLEKEIAMLKNYVSIQENRFGDRIQFFFELDKSLDQVQVPRLILQPLLENAVTHGVGMKVTGGMIRIQTCRTETQCVITVTDNGQGMSREQIGAVRKGMREKSSGQRIGLSNVYMRLQVLFGDEAKLQIESNSGEGTAVSITLPLSVKGEDERSSCTG